MQSRGLRVVQNQGNIPAGSTNGVKVKVEQPSPAPAAATKSNRRRSQPIQLATPEHEVIGIDSGDDHSLPNNLPSRRSERPDEPEVLGERIFRYYGRGHIYQTSEFGRVFRCDGQQLRSIESLAREREPRNLQRDENHNVRTENGDGRGSGAESSPGEQDDNSGSEDRTPTRENQQRFSPMGAEDQNPSDQSHNLRSRRTLSPRMSRQRLTEWRAPYRSISVDGRIQVYRDINKNSDASSELSREVCSQEAAGLASPSFRKKVTLKDLRASIGQVNLCISEQFIKQRLEKLEQKRVFHNQILRSVVSEEQKLASLLSTNSQLSLKLSKMRISSALPKHADQLTQKTFGLFEYLNLMSKPSLEVTSPPNFIELIDVNKSELFLVENTIQKWERGFIAQKFENLLITNLSNVVSIFGLNWQISLIRTRLGPDITLTVDLICLGFLHKTKMVSCLIDIAGRLHVNFRIPTVTKVIHENFEKKDFTWDLNGRIAKYRIVHTTFPSCYNQLPLNCDAVCDINCELLIREPRSGNERDEENRSPL